MEARGASRSRIHLDIDPEIQVPWTWFSTKVAQLLSRVFPSKETKERSSLVRPKLSPRQQNVAGGRTVPSLLKFRKFTLYFYSGMHRTGSIIQTLGVLIFKNYFSSSSIFGFFWNNSNHSCLVCQHCKFTPSCYRL